MRCNGDFGKAEAALRNATTPLLNLLKIRNRDGTVPALPLNVEIRGLDLKSLPAFIDGEGAIRLVDVVKQSATEDGRKLRQGFFLSRKAGDTFAERARAKGETVKEREVPHEIVVEANLKLSTQFAFSLEARKVAAKIVLAAVAYKYGIPFALSPQFDVLRHARVATGDRDLRVWIFASDGLMSAQVRTAHQHSVMCYLSAGMRKGWAVVTLFGGITYRVDVTMDYTERESRQFSIFYDAESKKRVNPILLCDEMTLIGHVLSPASEFENRDAVDAQWWPIISRFCAQKGIEVERVGRADDSSATG
jgi:hypothetical protein